MFLKCLEQKKNPSGTNECNSADLDAAVPNTQHLLKLKFLLKCLLFGCTCFVKKKLRNLHQSLRAFQTGWCLC